MMATQRLTKEWAEIERNPPRPDAEFTLSTTPPNILRWTGVLRGPADTPYQGGRWNIAFEIPRDYPMDPPKVTFQTQIFHPNVNWPTGEICLDILKSHWTPVWTLQAVCRAILQLLSDPIADSPLNCDAGNMLRAGDTAAFQSTARMYAIDLAGAPR